VTKPDWGALMLCMAFNEIFIRHSTVALGVLSYIFYFFTILSADVAHDVQQAKQADVVLRKPSSRVSC